MLLQGFDGNHKIYATTSVLSQLTKVVFPQSPSTSHQPLTLSHLFLARLVDFVDWSCSCHHQYCSTEFISILS